MFEFIEMFAPHLSRKVVDAALRCSSQAEVDALFSGCEVPAL
jgi:LysR family cys regulon transcriptional activator